MPSALSFFSWEKEEKGLKHVRSQIPTPTGLLLPLSIVNAKREEGGPKDPLMIREVLYRVFQAYLTQVVPIFKL